MNLLVLDGRSVSTEPGLTLLEACRASGIAVPTLCHLQGVSFAANCRVCLVEVGGLERPVPACATLATDGMEVRTDSPALRSHRRAVTEMLFASGDHVCAHCPASGSCELQDLARAVGLDHLASSPAVAAGIAPPDLEAPGGAPPRPPGVDASHARFALDAARCILCTRCIRVCAEVEGAHALGEAGRGAATRVILDGGGRWRDSAACTDCGRCVTACPTGAIFEKVAVLPELSLRPPLRPHPTSGYPERASAGRSPGTPTRLRVATAWLGGCSGCHMSLLDMDERLLDLASRMDLVYSPLVDAKVFPEDVDVCLVEGAVAGEDHAALARRIRERTRVLVALGDCAATGNVTALRDGVGGAGAVLRRAWAGASGAPLRPDPGLPALLDRVRPLHEVVPVDLFLPGCPPPAGAIHRLLDALLDGVAPDLAGGIHFG
jgi:ferredoxin